MDAAPFSREGHLRSPDFDFFGMIRRRVVLSLAASVAWLCGVLLYVAFWSAAFSWFQSVILLIVSLLALFALLAGAWVSFGLRFVQWP